ncbi:MAG: PTS transporter subunit EIIB [Faecousia sp.]
MTNQELSLKILELVGGKENVTAVTNCMTRLRVNLADYSKANIEELKKVEGVLQVIEMDNLHVVLGPGKAKKVTDQFKADCGLADGGMAAGGDWKENKATLKAGQKQGKVKMALKAVGDIFVPMIRCHCRRSVRRRGYSDHPAEPRLCRCEVAVHHSPAADHDQHCVHGLHHRLGRLSCR